MKAIKVVSTKDMPYEEWLKWRKAGIGGSEAASIAGLNPWSSPIRVYIDKIDEQVQVQEDNERMRVGRDLEDYVAKRFEEATGKKVKRLNYLLQHPEHPFMLANLDRDIIGENAFLECKTTGSYSKSEWEEGVPLHYEIQCLHYMAVTGYTHCYIACLVGNEKFIWHRIDRDEETIENLIKIEKDFWEGNILTQTPPEPDGTSEYTEIIKNKYIASIPESIELDKKFEDKLMIRDSLEEQIKSLEVDKKLIDQEIQLEMQENERAVVGERVITWKSQSRTTVDSKKLKEEAPDVYEKYTKTTSNRVFKVK